MNHIANSITVKFDNHTPVAIEKTTRSMFQTARNIIMAIRPNADDDVVSLVADKYSNFFKKMFVTDQRKNRK
jgi:hypothetical protein